MVRGLKNIVLSFLVVCISNTCFAIDISDGINAYKNGKYDVCIETMKSIVKNDPTSVMGYYYLALAYTKTGKDVLAVQNYNKVINLNSDSTMTALAKQGKEKLGNKKVNAIEEQIEDIEEEYNPILNDEAVNNKVEPQTQEAEVKTTTVIKASDYAQAQTKQNTPNTSPNREPTNDEIVNAIKTLQKAGLLQNGAMGLNGGMTPSMPMDSRTQQMYSMMQMMNNGNNNNNMMQMMPYMNNGGKVDPQMMQIMLMQQMMPNFSGGNNNGNGY
jgi:hypothetical protein